MNGYLIDTHILLWWLSDDGKLDQNIRNRVFESKENIFVSVVSIWEIIIKKHLGKLSVPDGLEDILIENNFKVLSVQLGHILTLDDLPFIHKDPFDRLLISQTIYESLVFVTKDSIIPKYGIDCY